MGFQLAELTIVSCVNRPPSKLVVELGRKFDLMLCSFTKDAQYFGTASTLNELPSCSASSIFGIFIATGEFWKSKNCFFSRRGQRPWMRSMTYIDRSYSSTIVVHSFARSSIVYLLTFDGQKHSGDFRLLPGNLAAVIRRALKMKKNASKRPRTISEISMRHTNEKNLINEFMRTSSGPSNSKNTSGLCPPLVNRKSDSCKFLKRQTYFFFSLLLLHPITWVVEHFFQRS